jgi:SEC-C motif-containing protein
VAAAKHTSGPRQGCCPCGSQLGLAQCCGRFIEGTDIAGTAELLMRSRYSAFVLCNQAYLVATWHPDTRPSRVSLDPEQRWLGLSIRATGEGAAGDESGTVEFVVRFKLRGKGHRLHELSRFKKIDGHWYYLDGQHL